MPRALGAIAVRSQRRREREAARRANLPVARKVGLAIAASAVLAPLAQQTATAQTHATATAHEGMLRKGDTGPAVAAVQRALGIPVDGGFGPQTRRAVKSFQARHGLEVDGVVGPLTQGALAGGGGKSGSGATGPAPPREVTVAVQSKLGLAADGVYGPQSRAAVRAFQARHGLEVDGVVGPATMSALGISGASAPSPAGGGGGSAVSVARSMIGTPYAVAGIAPGGFDCSGLMVYSFRQAGVTLPRTSFAQFGAGVAVTRANIEAGDLVFFNASGPGASHVGIATSNSTVISATTHGVMEHTIGGEYWGMHYVARGGCELSPSVRLGPNAPARHPATPPRGRRAWSRRHGRAGATLPTSPRPLLEVAVRRHADQRDKVSPIERERSRLRTTAAFLVTTRPVPGMMGGVELARS